MQPNMTNLSKYVKICEFPRLFFSTEGIAFGCLGDVLPSCILVEYLGAIIGQSSLTKAWLIPT